MKVFPTVASVLVLAFFVGGIMPADPVGGAGPASYRAAAVAAGQVVINEFIASNSIPTHTDPQGETDDWIELHNITDVPVDVGGMYVTDDLGEPMKWQIPTGDPSLTTIPARGYLVIWADSDVTDEGLHASFALSADGEEVGLFATDGVTLLDSVTFGPQFPNVSYGRYPDGSDAWFQMTLPTPGASNVLGAQGVVAEPEFTFDHGFYDREIPVAILCETEGAIIYYTTDGSEPYLADTMGPGARAVVYNEPVRISRTTCLRAVGVKADWKPSPIETRTYIFLADVVRQSPTGGAPGPGWPTGAVNGQRFDYGMDPDVLNDPRYRDLVDDALLAIPSVSLVTDLPNLFDPQKGIYVNAERYGSDWERPVSVELIHPNESAGFQVDAGLRIRGGYSRIDSNPKHAFRLFFRGQYGASRLKYPLFGDEGADEFENIDLRTSQNYSWAYDGDRRNTFVREVFSRDTQRDMGQPYTRSRYYHLYLNGQYWGLYQTQERAEAAYAQTYFGGDKDDYDVIKAAGRNADYIIEATDGTLDTYRVLWETAAAGFFTDEPYYRLQGLDPNGTPHPESPRLLDPDNLIDYMLCTFYVGDFDGPISNFLGNARVNNFFGILNRVNPDGVKWFRHDAEHTLIDNNGWGLDRTGPYTHPNLARFSYFCPQWLQQRLLEHPEFRMRFADRTHKHFFNDGALMYARSKERMLARAAQIELAIVAESVRWGDSKRSSPYTKADWQNEVNRIINDYGDYGLPNRTVVVLGQLRADGWYPTIDAPEFSPHGGHVSAGFALRMEASNDIYYTLDGTDPRLPQKAGGATGAEVLVPEIAAKRVLVPAEDVADAWKGGEAFDDSAWTRVAGSPGGVGYERSSGYESLISLDVSAQMHGVTTGCYVRIPFTVTGDPERYGSLVLKARYDDGFIAYLNGTEVQRVGFTGTPRWDSAAESNHEADVTESFPLGEYIDLLREGQNVLAIHALNVSTTSSDFLILASLEAGEDVPLEGGGISDTAIKYTGPVTLNKSTQVKARAYDGNTWSALNEAVFAVGPVAQSLRINEIMYHPLDGGDPADPNSEYIELTNIGAERINLNLVQFTRGVHTVLPSVELSPGRYCLLVKDLAAFQAKYGLKPPVVGRYTGSLDNAGERIELRDAAGTIIHDFRYDDDWFDITDGLGFSLTVRDPQMADPNMLNGKSAWRPSAHIGGSPGTDDSGQAPELGSVVINELLANSQGSGPDWIELHNTTSQAIDIGGWFLSDDADDLLRYEIAAGTSIAAGGYVVFTETLHFNNSVDPGCRVPFALSAEGETLYLHSGSGGVLGGYSEQEKFGASEAGVSLGRRQKSTGSYNFVALSEPTPGAANAPPKVGPVVIHEIMYHPDAPADAEYVELLNISDTPVTLYDDQREVPWRFTDDPQESAVELLLPTDPPVTLAAGEYLLLVKDVSLFQSRYSAPADVQILSWGPGRLANGTGPVQLSKPGDLDSDNERAWVRMDRVVYSDGLHDGDFPAGTDPWPTEAAGGGRSLSRIDPTAYGNDPANWQAATPTPGSINN